MVRTVKLLSINLFSGKQLSNRAIFTISSNRQFKQMVLLSRIGPGKGQLHTFSYEYRVSVCSVLHKFALWRPNWVQPNSGLGRGFSGQLHPSLISRI